VTTPTRVSARSVSWSRRAALTVGGVVALSGVAPALANAAGAHLANPVVVALRAFGSSADEPCAPTASASAEPTAVPTAEPTAEPTATPTEAPETEAPETEAPETEAPDCDEPTPAPTSASPAATSAAPESEAPEAPEADDAHGTLVSTVAHCAPHGKDPLLAVAGTPANHGAYVRAAAHGDSLTTPWGTFDLSGQAGADALCTALTAARTDLPPAAPKVTHGKHHAAAPKPAKRPKHSPRHGG
jgi:hypothetical protein